MIAASMTSLPTSATRHAGTSDVALSGTLDRGDLRIVAVSFGFAAGLVLAAALACNAYLLAMLRSAPTTIAAIAEQQLAVELLPWTASFTGVVLASVLSAAWLPQLLDRASRGRVGLR